MKKESSLEISAKRVGIWLRVSTEDQAKGETLEHHEARARMYAESRGWDVVEVYRLGGVSGKDSMNHAEGERMLADIHRGHITALIFSKLARLARNTRHLLEMADQFQKDGADLVSLQENIDTSTPAGRLFYTMFAALAQWEREEISGRVAASVPVRAKMGKIIGGQPPFGYQFKDKRLVPHPEEAAVVRVAYELFAEHKRKKRVARLLNERGYRTRSGSAFTDSTIERIIRGTTYKGKHRVNYTSHDASGKIVEKPESEWVWLDVEPIVNEQTWAICNAVFEERTGVKYVKPAKQTVHLLAGFTFCQCGAKMYVPSNTPKYVCQKCRNKVPIVDLEGIFHEQLKGFVFSPSDVSAHLRQAQDRIDEKIKLIEANRAEQQRLKGEMDIAYRALVEGHISGPVFAERHNPLEERQKQLRIEIPRIQGEIDFLRICQLSADQIISEAQDLATRWPKFTATERRSIVEQITDRVTVGSDEINITLLYVPSSVELMANRQHHQTGSGG